MDSGAWTPVDPLGEALHSLRMSGVFYCRSEFTAPWALDLPPMRNTLMFHAVTQGRCWLEARAIPRRLLQAGDFVLVPHGEGHRLTSEPGVRAAKLFDLPREPVSERYEVLRHGGGGDATSIVCGAVRFDHPAARHLVEVLPRLVAVDGWTAPQRDWLQSTLRFIAAEASELRTGGETVITRLADILVIQAIRSWIEKEGGARAGWLGALRDRQVGRAIALVHREPARAWTVAALAGEVAMSRSAFAARFAELVGETPMRYLARWRSQVAMAALKEEEATVGELAARLGYKSEAAFGRAFKRLTGLSPGAVRRGAAMEPAG